MNKYKLIALSLSGGILSGFAWTDWCPGLILLISFVPFFYIENYLYENRRMYSSGAYFTYLLPGTNRVLHHDPRLDKGNQLNRGNLHNIDWSIPYGIHLVAGTYVRT